MLSNAEIEMNISRSRVDTRISHSKIEHLEAATPKQTENFYYFMFIDIDNDRNVIECATKHVKETMLEFVNYSLPRKQVLSLIAGLMYFIYDRCSIIFYPKAD